MLRRLKNKLHKIEISIQMKLIAVFLIMTVVLFGVNVYIYSNLDEMMLQIEQVYASNTELNELQNILTLVMMLRNIKRIMKKQRNCARISGTTSIA